MMGLRRYIITVIIAATALMAAAQQTAPSGPRVVRKSEAPDFPETHETVIVGSDTVPLVMKERNFGRYDRGLFNYLFIPKGKWSFGLTASYGELNTEDVRVLSLLQNVDFNARFIRSSHSYHTSSATTSR